MKAYVMRGIPGAGKDWWLQHNLPLRSIIISADSKRMVEGKYVYNKADDPEIHAECLRNWTELVMNANTGVIAVSNTNIRAYEFMPYYRIAEAYGWDVQIVWIQADPELCIKRNVHSVPETTIRNMLASFDPIPSWWNLKVVINA